MVSIRNIRKFFDDHPEYADYRDSALAIADRLRGQSLLLGGLDTEEVMGGLATKFFLEVTTNAEHIHIGLQDIASETNGPN